MRSLIFAGLIVTAGFAGLARADGLIYQLPDDGSQIAYEAEISVTVNGREQLIPASVTLSSVGKSRLDNESCRWIEVKITNADRAATVAKLLVPEDHLGKGKSALDHVIRGWLKEGNRDPRLIKDFKETPMVMLAVFLAGPPKKIDELEKKEITSKIGTLACGGISGAQEVSFGENTLHLSFENRLHEKAPFGVVTGLWKFETRKGDVVIDSGRLRLLASEIKAGAVSELPNNN